MFSVIINNNLVLFLSAFMETGVETLLKPHTQLRLHQYVVVVTSTFDLYSSVGPTAASFARQRVVALNAAPPPPLLSAHIVTYQTLTAVFLFNKTKGKILFLRTGEN